MLAKSSLQPSSIPTYRRAWTLFYQFLNTIFQSVSNSFPISPNTLALFIAYMYNRNYAPSTVSSYVSALGYSHKFLGYSDPTKAFFIIQMLKGYNELGDRLDARLPITLPVLQKLIESSAALSISEFQCFQFRAMSTTAFFAFLRIGEMTHNSAKDASNLILQFQHVSKLVDSSNYVVALKITFGNFKHSYNQRPFTIFLNRQNSCCPVQFLLQYLARRGNRLGPLFLNPDNNPVSRKFFADLLSLSLKACGRDSTRYKGHSFRISAASFAAERGMSDAQIRALGGWKSTAFLKYIRIPSPSTIFLLHVLLA